MCLSVRSGALVQLSYGKKLAQPAGNDPAFPL